jgi:hypothetical protein
MGSTAVVLGMRQIFGIDPVTDGEAWNAFVEGWASFTDWHEVLPLVVNVLLAVLLMLPFVYGQRKLGRFHSLARIDEQKALVTFAAVSAAVAVLVLEHPAMALVIFGMGGLLRFRTPTSSERGTGRAVFAVVIGLACGLSLYALAVTLTILGYVTMWRLEGRNTLELTVKKLSPERLEESLTAYRAAIRKQGGRVAGVRTETAHDQFTMVLDMPRGVSFEEMIEAFKLEVPEELQGKMHADLGSD